MELKAIAFSSLSFWPVRSSIHCCCPGGTRSNVGVVFFYEREEKKYRQSHLADRKAKKDDQKFPKSLFKENDGTLPVNLIAALLRCYFTEKK